MSSGGYRLRTAPRRGRGKKSRIHWDRLGRIVLVIVIFAILVSYINPAANLVDSWSDSRAERAALAERKAENERLRERLDNLSSPDAAERAARRIGMVAEGEQPYAIKGLGRD